MSRLQMCAVITKLYLLKMLHCTLLGYNVIYGKNYFAANRTQSRAGKYKVKLHLAETEMCLNFVAFVIPSNKTS